MATQSITVTLTLDNVSYRGIQQALQITGLSADQLVSSFVVRDVAPYVQQLRKTFTERVLALLDAYVNADPTTAAQVDAAVAQVTALLTPQV